MSRIALEYWRTWLARSRGRESTSISSTSPRRTAWCSGPRTSPSSALHSASRVERSSVLLRLAAGAADQPPPVGRAEDEDQRQRAEDRRPGRDVEDRADEERGDHRRVGGAPDRALGEEDLHGVADPCRDDAVETGPGQVGGGDAGIWHLPIRIGRA